MSYNGSGTFNLYSPGNPVVTGTTISSTWANNTLSDIAIGLSTAITKDGQTTPTANLPMGGYKFTGLAAGSTAGDSLRYEQLFTTSAVALLGPMNWVTGSSIASAATVNLTTATGNAAHITGTTAITAVTLGSGIWRLVIFDDALTLTHHATNNNLPGGGNITTAAGDRALYYSDGTTVYCANYQKANGMAIVPTVSPSPITASLGANVSLNNTANYFDGPSIAQGSTGTWFASGTVTLNDTGGAATFYCKLWDGTTVIASAVGRTIAANNRTSVSLSGYLASPAGNLRISVKDISATTGLIEYNTSGESKDSTITAYRVE